MTEKKGKRYHEQLRAPHVGISTNRNESDFSSHGCFCFLFLFAPFEAAFRSCLIKSVFGRESAWEKRKSDLIYGHFSINDVDITHDLSARICLARLTFSVEHEFDATQPQIDSFKSRSKDIFRKCPMGGEQEPLLSNKSWWFWTQVTPKTLHIP